MLLLSPWPESLYAFWPMWPELARQFALIAVDLPGFGQSQGRPDLMSPQAMGEFVTRLAAELVPGPVHAVGPDVGTGALLSAAAAHPDAFRSLVVGAGAATYPLRVGGVLKDLIDAPSLDALAQIDPADVVHRVAGAIQGHDMPGFVLDDYLASTPERGTSNRCPTSATTPPAWPRWRRCCRSCTPQSRSSSAGMIRTDWPTTPKHSTASCPTAGSTS